MTFKKPTGALENYRCLIPQSPGDKAPLTEEETKMYLQMFMADDTKVSSVWAEATSESGKLFLAKILENRLASVGMADFVDPKLKFLCTYLSTSPGQIVMWAFTLALMAVEAKGKVGLKEFSEIDYFGFGVPTEEFSLSQWDKQKRSSEGHSSDNWLDSPSLWPCAVSEQGQGETKQDEEKQS